MSDSMVFYQQQATESPPPFAEWLPIKKAALADFSRLGFPTKQHEDWKYTKLDSFLAHQFSVKHAPLAKENKPTRSSPFDNVVQVMLPQGQFGDEEHHLMNQLPKGVLILPLATAWQRHPDKIKPYLARMLSHAHGLQALNTAMLHHGLFIYVPEGVVVDKHVLVHHLNAMNEHAMFLRHVVVAAKDSSLTLIEDYESVLPDLCYFTNVITEIYTEAGAQVQHYKVQRESKSAYHFSHVVTQQAAHSKVETHLLNLGGVIARSDTTMQFMESGAYGKLNGIYMPQASQHMDHHTTVLHQVEACTSEQDYKGILSGHSRAVFNGQVVVAKLAQQTRAMQQNKNILLSTQAEVDTKPQLEIFADDVTCSHGATVGQLDEEALFYLATRGINPVAARHYLIRAFATENLKALKHTDIAQWFAALLNQQLEGMS